MPSLEGCAGDKIYNSQPIYLKLNGAYQVHSSKVLKLNKCGYFLKHIAHTHQTFKVSHELMLFRPSLNEVESMMVNNETRERSAQLGLILVSPSSSSCIIIFLWDFFFQDHLKQLLMASKLQSRFTPALHFYHYLKLSSI